MENGPSEVELPPRLNLLRIEAEEEVNLSLPVCWDDVRWVDPTVILMQ